MTSRRVRGPAAHRAADRAAACKTLSVCYLPSRAPRWGAPTGDAARRRAGGQATHRADGAAARWGHRALPQRDRTTRHGRCARRRGARGAGCQAAHCGREPPRAKARRRDGDIAPYRNGTVPWNTTTGRTTGRGRGALRAHVEGTAGCYGKEALID